MSFFLIIQNLFLKLNLLVLKYILNFMIRYSNKTGDLGCKFRIYHPNKLFLIHNYVVLLLLLWSSSFFFSIILLRSDGVGLFSSIFEIPWASYKNIFVLTLIYRSVKNLIFRANSNFFCRFKFFFGFILLDSNCPLFL